METRIREAVYADGAAIVRLVHRFLAGSPYGAFLQFNPDALADFVLFLLEHDKGVVFVAEQEVAIGKWTAVGMIAAIAGPHPITGDGTVEELAWWVNEEVRGGRLGYKLLGHLEDWARQKGHLMLKMVAPVDSAVGRIYERLGYTPLETVFLKRL